MIWNFRKRWFVGLCVRVKRHMYLYWCSHARSRLRAPSPRDTHMHMKTVSTPHVCWSAIAMYMGHLSIYVPQRTRWVQTKFMFLYTWVMSSFAMSHVSIYVVYTWIHVSKYINHVLLRLQQRVHRVQARVVLCIYTCGMFLLTIRSVSIYAYVSEYAKCKHGSSSYVPESCHMYIMYT